jgi:hypothetical protein
MTGRRRLESTADRAAPDDPDVASAAAAQRRFVASLRDSRV